MSLPQILGIVWHLLLAAGAMLFAAFISWQILQGRGRQVAMALIVIIVGLVISSAFWIAVDRVHAPVHRCAVRSMPVTCGDTSSTEFPPVLRGNLPGVARRAVLRALAGRTLTRPASFLRVI